MVDLVVIGIAIVVLLFLLSGIRVVREYERGVIFRLGRLIGARGPGLFFVIPILENMMLVDLRTYTYDVPSQEVVTRDNVTVKVNAVVYYRVLDPEKAVTEVFDYRFATSQIAQTTLRSVIGQAELDDLLSNREKLNVQLQRIIDEATNPWGIKVSAVEIKDVELPKEMQRAMAMQAEAERERRAKIIRADGEFQAAKKLKEAADVMMESKGAMMLRILQTISETTNDPATKIVFPIPIEVLEYFRLKKD
ncbi:SPFH domain, Band 7 family protein [Archaeoglobus sulfaticallidus PM70-1]|uniref:SPFH domain, Band 7 family protein n=1 Tax=Archaeoglobus sulfaticallidus PM70-1 TaxID=387631 RepID=N0BE89_9EURY|nr:slipin family protein [Archaeoglobus sulfaticallidus]AGK61939.1 SPFH domain, Band 7 family protein [Archaeoglobus sulfaticallidus PM70-1]